MNEITSLITQTVDLDRGVERPAALKQHLVYANAGAHTFRLLCMRGGKPVSLDGMQCVGYVRRKDGVTIPVDGSTAGNTASVTLTAPCYAVPGSVLISMELISGECRATHALWIAQVECPVTDQIGGEAAVSISDALTRLNAAARPDWAQNAEDMPDHIRHRTHYSYRVTADCTQSLGTTDGWQRVSSLYCEETLLPSEGEDVYQPRVLAEEDGVRSELALTWFPDERFTDTNEDGLPISGWTKTYGQISDPAFGDLAGAKKLLMMVHRATADFAAGVYIHPENIAAAIPSKTIVSLDWLAYVPLADRFIPDAIARAKDVPRLDSALTEAGCAADAAAVGSRLSAMEAHLDETLASIDYDEVTNLLDPALMVADGYWEGWASHKTASGYMSMEIPVKAGVAYSSNAQIDKNFSWYVPEDNAYCKIMDTGAATAVGASGQFCQLENFIPETNGKLRITSRTYYEDTIILVNAPTAPGYYTAYGVVRERKIGGQPMGNAALHVVTVAKDGSGDYTTISAAAEYARYHEHTTVYVRGGTYDIIEEMGDAYFNAFDADTSESSGIVLTNGVRMVFASNSLVTCHYTGSNAYVKRKFSPFVVDKGNHRGFSLVNLHLEASNVRYCVHDDVGGQQAPYRNVYRNCHMYIDNTANTAWSAEMCIGGGTGAGTEVLIEGCYFDSGVTKGWNPKVVNYHNCNATWSPCRANIVIRDCYFAGMATCGCSHYGTHDEMSRMMVTGCSMAVAPSTRFEDESAFDQENFELIAWNNEIRTA